MKRDEGGKINSFAISAHSQHQTQPFSTYFVYFRISPHKYKSNLESVQVDLTFYNSLGRGGQIRREMTDFLLQFLRIHVGDSYPDQSKMWPQHDH